MPSLRHFGVAGEPEGSKQPSTAEAAGVLLDRKDHSDEPSCFAPGDQQPNFPVAQFYDDALPAQTVTGNPVTPRTLL